MFERLDVLFRKKNYKKLGKKNYKKLEKDGVVGET